MKSLHLLIPGLLGPWPAAARADLPPPQAPALERLLARATAKTLAVTGAEATLFKLFGLPVAGQRDLPIAAITRLADGGNTDSGWWLRADPVHLRADLRQVLLFDARSLQITPAEAESLVAEFNQTFGEDGLILQSLHVSRWYLRLDADPDLRTCPLPEAIGQDINGRLPSGPASRRWHSLLTEIQMLFHNAPVNLEREARGLPPINSVWFWGGGILPAGAHPVVLDGIYSSDPLARGLARLAGVPVSFLPENSAEWYSSAGAERETLVVLEMTRFDPADNHPQDWVEHVNSLEKNWFSNCLEMLKDRLIRQLCLYPCDGRLYRLTPHSLRRFWRRSRPLPHYCKTSPS